MTIINPTKKVLKKCTYDILIGSLGVKGDKHSKSELISYINFFQLKSLAEIPVSVKDMTITNGNYLEAGYIIHIVNYPKLDMLSCSTFYTFANDLAIYLLDRLNQRRVLIEVNDLCGSDTIMYENQDFID